MLRVTIAAAAAIILLLNAGQNSFAAEKDYSGPNFGLVFSLVDAFDDQVEDPGNPPYGFGAEIEFTAMGGGVTAGYDWQRGYFVIGILGDLQLFSGEEDTFQWETTRGNLSTDYPVSAELQAQGTLRARIGAILAGNLVYATGGFVLARIERGYYDPVNSPSRSIHTDWQNGYVYGGGIERDFANGVALRLEFLRTVFDDEIVDPSILSNFCCDQAGDFSSDQGKLVVLKRF